MCNLKFTRFLISKMSNQNFENNGVNRARPVGEGSLPGSCSLVWQRGPGHHATTAKNSGLRMWIRLLWNVYLEVGLLMMTVSRSEDTNNKWCRNGRNMESLKSPSNDCKTKQELLWKVFASLIWSLKIFGWW